MKFKINKKFLISLIIFLLLVLYTNISNAATDIINNYTVKVTPRYNGTLDINYHIEWEVLDSSSVGPLIDLYVGIANNHVDSIAALSNNIARIEYTSRNNGKSGDYVYIKLNKKYNTGDIAIIDFTLHQSYMYNISSSNIVTYSFTPGWFKDVKVKSANIYWDSNNVQSSTSKKEDDGYLVWNKSLSYGQKITAEVNYSKNSFTGLNLGEQAHVYETISKNNKTYTDTVSSYFPIIFLIIIISLVISVSTMSSNSYYSHSGYGYYDSPYYDYSSSRRHRNRYRSSYSRTSSSHSSCVSSCACACACAGGGRAGCSKKDLYGIKISQLKNILNK